MNENHTTTNPIANITTTSSIVPTIIKRVTIKNFDKEIINFENDLKNATFISIDTEFTGLGYQKGLKQDDIQEKYQAMCNLVKQRSILEFGISIFTANFKQDIINNIDIIDNNNNLEESSAATKGISTDYCVDNGNTKNEDLGEQVTISHMTTISSSSSSSTSTNTTSATNTADTSPTTTLTTSTTPSPSSLERNYSIRVYNFIMLNISDFQVSPSSMSFLSKHGFDFQELFLYGIPFQSRRPYNNTPTKTNSTNTNTNTNINNNEELLRRSKLLFELIKKSQLPSVIHNGIFDLLFIFQSLIGDLPEKLNDFIAKILSVFPKIYDTKYIAEYKINEKRSYLQYLFQKYERFNFKRLQRKESYATCNFKSFNDNQDNDNQSSPPPPPKYIPLINTEYSFSKPFSTNIKICNDFADHGFCKLKENCPDSHDISLILDQEENKNQKKKRRRNKIEFDNSETDENEETEISIVNNNNIINSNNTNNTINYKEIFKMEGQNVHSAGFDSALTGFIFTYYLLLFKNSNLQSEVENKVFLSGKQIPLVLKVSKYA